ncbi:MAG TPA: hypothetical protein VM554_14730 [Acidisarcina sp.]|nr:hypothetical protein [Acidisarcina sp.]
MLLLGIVFGLVTVGSFYADYRWKRWMAQRREARELDEKGGAAKDRG